MAQRPRGNKATGGREQIAERWSTLQKTMVLRLLRGEGHSPRPASVSEAALSTPLRYFGFQWKSFRVLDGFYAQIYIQIRPVEVPGRRLLNLENVPNRNLFEPREILIRKKKFLLTDEKPYPMSRYIGYFNARSDFAKLF